MINLLKAWGGKFGGKSAEQRLQIDQNNFCCSTQDTHCTELREGFSERSSNLTDPLGLGSPNFPNLT